MRRTIHVVNYDHAVNRRIAFASSIAVLLIGMAVMLLRNNCYCAAGPDSSGYMNEARLIASGRRSVPIAQTVIPTERFVPLGFTRWGERPAMVPTYPPGLPILVAAFAAIGGWAHAAFLVVPFTAIGCVVLTALLASELGVSRWMSVAGAAILALTPFFIFHALVVMSDVPATFFVLLAVWFARRGANHAGWAAAAGLSFACAVATRPTNLLVVIAIICALRWRLRGLVCAAASAIPIGAALMWLSSTWYGSPWRTGYGSLTDVVGAGFPCAVFHLKTLATMLTLVLAGAFAVFDGTVARRERAILACWFGPLLLFYSMYNFCSNWTFARFLLPAVPALIIGFLLLLHRFGDALERRKHPAAARFAVMAMLLLVLYVAGRASSQLRVFRSDDQDAQYPRLVHWARAQMPEHSRLLAGVASGAWFYYTNTLAVRWDGTTRQELERVRNAPQFRGVAWYALISDKEFADPPFQGRFAGSWRVAGRMGDVTLWRLEP